VGDHLSYFKRDKKVDAQKNSYKNSTDDNEPFFHEKVLSGFSGLKIGNMNNLFFIDCQI